MEQYTYYAFISYTEADEKWARRLQWSLEHYRIPVKLRKQDSSLPKLVRPVFWYKTDLAGAHLSGAIRQELKMSRYLIVVCSPSAAASQWVNDEVNIFKNELGRGDRIIPFVVDGSIDSDGGNCLPEPIRNLSKEEELRAIDVRNYGRNKALVNVVATILGLRFDLLWDRFQRERRLRMEIVTLILAVLFLLWDGFLHVKSRYYVDYADCNGYPTGIIALSTRKAHQHENHYRFEYRAGRLIRVSHVNSHDIPITHNNTELSDRSDVMELNYSEGELSYIIHKNRGGQVLYKAYISRNKLYEDLKDESGDRSANFITTATAVDRGLIASSQKNLLDGMIEGVSSYISRYMYERDDDGYIVKKLFGRNNGDDTIGIDKEGISGFLYERDHLHRPIAIWFIDKKGDKVANQRGVAGKRYEYDDNGCLSKTEYVDLDGQLKYNELHWARSVCIYDSKGRTVEEFVYGPDGAPCILAQGYHRAVWEYGKNVIITSFYNIQGDAAITFPISSNPGLFSSIIDYYKPGTDFLIERHYLDKNGNLCFNSSRSSIDKVEYNEFGKITDVRYYDMAGNPCIINIGMHHMHHIYNPQGQLLEESYYGLGEQRVNVVDGVHKWSNSYDNLGRLVKLSSFNNLLIPWVGSQMEGAAEVVFSYEDASRYPSMMTFFDINGQKLVAQSKAPIVKYERDDLGKIVRMYYCDADGIPARGRDFSIVERDYNEAGLETERRFFDFEHKPVVDGVYRRVQKYSKNGLLEEISLYGANGEYVCPEGVAIRVQHYEDGALSEVINYGPDYIPVEVNGTHLLRNIFDDNGRIIEQQVYDKHGNPGKEETMGAFAILFSYDEYGREVERVFLDKDRHPLKRPSVATIKTRFNDRQQVSDCYAYDSMGRLMNSGMLSGVAHIKYEYDVEDVIAVTYFLGEDDKEKNNDMGYSCSRNLRGEHKVESIFTDADGNMVDGPQKVSYMLIYYDENSQIVFEKKMSVGVSSNNCRTLLVPMSNGIGVEKYYFLNDYTATVYDNIAHSTIEYTRWDDEYYTIAEKVNDMESELGQKYGFSELY